MSVSSIGAAQGGAAFSVAVSTTYQTVVFTQQQPAGAYTFTSQTSNNTMDLYFFGSGGTLVTSTNGKAIQPSLPFSKLVIVGGTPGDVITFSAQQTFSGTAETSETGAGPVVLSTSPTSLPNVNSTTVVTGLNFASNVTATFTGTDNYVRNAKSIVYGSPTSIVVTRPDSMPTTYSPYTLTVTNPSVAVPSGSNKNTVSVTAGVNPVWVTSASQNGNTGFPLTAISATDADGASSITYSIVSGSFPTGVTLNTSTGAFTGIPTTAGTYNVTVRATDSGGNTADRSFTYSLTGGNITSDATYYYQTFLTNGTIAPTISVTADVFLVAGGGGGGGAGGGGGGGVRALTSQSIPAGSYAVTVGGGGSGGPRSSGGPTGTGSNGSNSVFNGLSATGGGFGGGYSINLNGSSGGSGGGGGNSNGSTAQGGSTGNAGGYTPVEGYSGGTGGNYAYTSGGGGGAGGSGANNTTSSSGNGGVGITSALSGTSYYWGGGGGGGLQKGSSTAGNGGLGGGGGGQAYGVSSTAGTGGAGLNNGGNGLQDTDGSTNAGSGGTNTGGGGGGMGISVGLAGSGGSGIVVIRYTRSQVGG